MNQDGSVLDNVVMMHCWSLDLFPLSHDLLTFLMLQRPRAWLVLDRFVFVPSTCRTMFWFPVFWEIASFDPSKTEPCISISVKYKPSPEGDYKHFPGIFKGA